MPLERRQHARHSSDASRASSDINASASRMEFKPVTQRWDGGRCQFSEAPRSIPITMPRAAESPPTLAFAMIACSKLLWYLARVK